MRECERQFGAQRGREIHELIEESIGGPCPCEQGIPCPLTPLGMRERRIDVVRIEHPPRAS